MKLSELAEAETEYELFVDIDGVLADFVKGVKKQFPEYTEEEYESDPKFRDEMWKAVKEFSKEGGKLWLGLDLLPDAKTLWNYVKKYDPEILSATGHTDHSAGEQKREWIAKHFGENVKVNLVQKAREKSKHAKENRVLIDDKKKAIDPWVKAGGIGILHTSAENTIKQLKELGL